MRHTLFYWGRQINFAVAVIIVFIASFITLTTCLGCLEKCSCVWTRGKLTADCGALGLTKILSQSYEFDSGIQVINLTRNNFVELKRHIFYTVNLLNLQKIYLQKVGLEKIDDHAFYRLANLIELDISHNNLREIPTPNFVYLPHLRNLDLSSNRISEVNSEAFKALKNMKDLSLERNEIRYIDDNAFIGLLNLEILKLSDNHLVELNNIALVPLRKLHSLMLGGNKWRCDCKMRQLREFLLMNSKINVPDKPECAKDNKVWTQMGLDSFLCTPRMLYDYGSFERDIKSGSNLELECALILDSGLEPHAVTVEWYWQGVRILNNSRGCSSDCNTNTQYYIITERTESNSLESSPNSEMLKISKLELSPVLEMNTGLYYCIARNRVGFVRKNFTVTVKTEPVKEDKSVKAAAASANSQINKNNEFSKDKTIATDSVVIGLILGIMCGIFLVLVLFGIGVIVLCRRRKRAESGSTQQTSTHEELEKLAPSATMTVINPVQKPPRLHFTTNPNATPQVWLIKRANGTLRSDFDGYCETMLPQGEGDVDSGTTTTGTTIEPDLIHPSAYNRTKRLLETDLDAVSIHSDGTEV